jgi:hypothetical protein
VFVDFESSLITINGDNFVQVVDEQELEPVVELANVGLAKDSYDNHQIVVQLPEDTDDGDYLLRVHNSKNTYCLYDLTIGAPGDSVVAGQHCTVGWVIGIDASGSLICSESPAVSCPCWDATTIDAYARAMPETFCFNKPGDAGQTSVESLQERVLLKAEYDEDTGFNVCEHTDPDNNISLGGGGFSAEVMNKCRGILLESSMWELNCGP